MVKMLNSTDQSTLNRNLSPSPPSDESTSSEFQILNAPPSNVNGTFSHLNDLCFSISNAVFDIPTEEIQTQLRELLKENVELKEMLHQNNVGLNEQFEKLLKWREEMGVVQEQHKQKFDETCVLVQQLRQENSELKKQIERLQSTTKENESLEAGIIILKKQVTDGEQLKEKLGKENERLAVTELMLKKELATVQNQYDSLKSKSSRLVVEKQELVALNNELSSKLAACQSISPFEVSLQQLEQLKSEDNQSYLMVSSSQSRSDPNIRTDKKAITELLLQLRVEQNKVATLNNDFLDEQKKNFALTKEIDCLKEQLVSLRKPSLEQPNTDVLNELKESESTFNMATNYLERYKERCTSLEHWLGENQGKLDILGVKNDTQQVQQLRDEMASLRHTLIEQRSLNQEDKKNLMESRMKFEMLLKDYQELLKSWESFQQEQNSRGRQSEAYYEIQIKKMNEQIDNLTAKLVCNEETLQNKVDEINRLKNQMLLSCQELDKVPILEAQVEVYQSDFRAERERSDKLYVEKGRLATEKQELQDRVRLLESEMRRRGSHEMPVDRTSPRVVQTIHVGNRRFGGDGASHGDYGFAESRRTPTKTTTSRLSTGNNQSGLNVLSRTEAPRATRSEQLSSSPDNNMYYCPKCNLGFTDFKPLENHVNECLDNDDPFVT